MDGCLDRVDGYFSQSFVKGLVVDNIASPIARETEIQSFGFRVGFAHVSIDMGD